MIIASTFQVLSRRIDRPPGLALPYGFLLIPPPIPLLYKSRFVILINCIFIISHQSPKVRSQILWARERLWNELRFDFLHFSVCIEAKGWMCFVHRSAMRSDISFLIKVRLMSYNKQGSNFLRYILIHLVTFFALPSAEVSHKGVFSGIIVTYWLQPKVRYKIKRGR